MIYVFIRSEGSFCIRRVTITGPGEGQPQRDLRLPDQPAALGLRPAAARPAAGDGPVLQRHGRPGQGGPPQLQGPRHREQNGQTGANFCIFIYVVEDISGSSISLYVCFPSFCLIHHITIIMSDIKIQNISLFYATLRPFRFYYLNKPSQGLSPDSEIRDMFICLFYVLPFVYNKNTMSGICTGSLIFI